MSVRRLVKDVIVHAPVKAVIKKIRGQGFSAMSVGKDAGVFAAADGLYMYSPLERWLLQGVFNVSKYPPKPEVVAVSSTLGVSVIELLLRKIMNRKGSGSMFSMSNIIDVVGSNAITFGIRDLTGIGMDFGGIIMDDQTSPAIDVGIIGNASNVIQSNAPPPQ